MPPKDEFPTTPSAAEGHRRALREAIETHGATVFLSETLWLAEMKRGFAKIERTASEMLCEEHAEAVLLLVDMYRELLDCLPDPLIIPDDPDARYTSPEERRHATRELIGIGRFVEWLMYRESNVPASDLAALFDFSDLVRESENHCRALSRLEGEAAAQIARAVTGRPPPQASLRLVHSVPDPGRG